MLLFSMISSDYYKNDVIIFNVLKFYGLNTLFKALKGLLGYYF